MTLETFQKLISHTGQIALATAMQLAPTENSRLAALETLRKRFPTDLAAAVLETVLLRKRAEAKFTHAQNMYFTREALEQSTHELVARYRAQRLAKFGRVVDLGCGIGGDAIALAQAGCEVTAVDRDAVRLAMCSANAEANGVKLKTLNADILTGELPAANAAFCDPARRVSGKRVLSPHDSDPPPREVLARFPKDFPIGFKLAPGINVDEAVAMGGEIEFISLDGELKECCVWMGDLRSTCQRATVLKGTVSTAESWTLTAETPAGWPDVTAIGPYLYDPDASIVRAGLVGDLAKAINLTAIDYRVAFLTGDLAATPFAVCYRVEDVCPLDAKIVAASLREKNVGRVTILKRGVEADVDKLNARWTTNLPGYRMVILTKIDGKQKAVIGERV